MTSPGGAQISSAKKRRLAALEQTLAKKQKAGSATPNQQGSSNRGAQPARSVQRLGTSARPGTFASPAAAPAQPGTSQGATAAIVPPYDRLCSTIAQGPLAQALQFRDVERGARVVEDLLDDVMRTNTRTLDSRAAQGAKLQDKTLMLDNPVAQLKPVKPQRLAGPSLREQAKKSSLPRRHPLRLCQEKMAQYQLQPGTQRYAYFEELHELWQDYVKLLFAEARSCEECLLTADMKGAKVKVAHSTNPIHAGKAGIVVKNTKNTFVVMTPEDRTHILPKAECVFECRLDKDRVATINGKQYMQARS